MHSVYLVRHGKSSLDGTESERGLEPEGEEHARYLGQRLAELSPPIKAVYTSPYHRAQLTIEPFAERSGLPVNVEDAFHEKIMSDGPVDDLKAARVKMWEDFRFRLPGGESCGQAQERALDALARIRAAHPDGAVAVSSHGTLIALILNAFDPSFNHAEWRAMPMPDIYRLDFDDDEHVATDHVGCPGVDGFKVDG